MEIQRTSKNRTPLRNTVIVLLVLILAIYSYNLFKSSVKYPTIPLELEASFLSDTYFTELSEQYDQIRSEYKKWYILDHSKAIASHAVLTRMMLDLTEYPELLYGHKHFQKFFDTFDEYVKQLPYITEEIHYFRNELNKYSGAPEQLEEMIELAACGKWQVFSAKFHRYEVEDYDAAYNVKFISADGRFEVVYNAKTGQQVTDPINMGTYNFAPGSIIPWEYYQHHKYDKVPWKKWGNTDEVSYKEIKQRESKHGSKEQKSSSDAVEEQIEDGSRSC